MLGVLLVIVIDGLWAVASLSADSCLTHSFFCSSVSTFADGEMERKGEMCAQSATQSQRRFAIAYGGEATKRTGHRRKKKKVRLGDTFSFIANSSPCRRISKQNMSSAHSKSRTCSKH